MATTIIKLPHGPRKLALVDMPPNHDNTIDRHANNASIATGDALAGAFACACNAAACAVVRGSGSFSSRRWTRGVCGPTGLLRQPVLWRDSAVDVELVLRRPKNPERRRDAFCVDDDAVAKLCSTPRMES
eukprot:CAMPEP_0178462454 /NCGR_PEP_ID=MMETSP0689_2-20121128/49831_1 /TAXON_ID=160604 /ORGANISM="Amphidinium massartii, Strain CS-259" /LENGTH=129 /DNA_ID=CAMNT_0020089317 /DNA_START=170 /DNA_END=560 /DNA_ORIENTATION=+